MSESVIEVQNAIVESHLADNFPLLGKYPSSSISSGGFDSANFSASYELTGLANRDHYIFLPHFEFNVGTKYEINIPRESMSGDPIYHESDRIRLKLKARNNGRLIEVTFPSVNDLFHLRNLASEDQLLSIPNVREEDRAVLPIEESQISASFYFRASSTTHGQLGAVMKINHPDAEEIIKHYLETIDRRFDDYRGLEQPFREKDQSQQYTVQRKKLHDSLFGELAEILMQGNLEYRID